MSKFARGGLIKTPPSAEPHPALRDLRGYIIPPTRAQHLAVLEQINAIKENQ